jgi:hypothetical protein
VDFVVYKGIRATPQEEERPQIPKLTNSLLNQRLINKIKIKRRPPTPKEKKGKKKKKPPPPPP